MTYIKPILMGEFQPQLFASLFPGQPIPNVRGGTAVVNLVRAHLSQNLPVDVLTLDPGATEPIVRLKSGLLNIWIVKRRPSRAVRDGFRQERELINAVLRESDADICHAHWTYEYGVAAVLQNIKPVVVTVHDHARNILRGFGWHYLGLYLLTQFVLRKAAGRLTAVSPYVADYAAKMSGKPVPVVPNVVLVDGCSLMIDKEHGRDEIAPVDGCQLSVDKETLTTRQPNNLSTKPAQPEPPASSPLFLKPKTSNLKPKSYPILLTLADSGRLKNVKRAVAAFSRLRKTIPQAQYVLIGSGLEAGGPLHRWAVKKGLVDGVQFCGWMLYDQALMLLHSSDVLFHPSLEESFGYPVAEALAAGVPVVATKQAQGCAWLLGGGKYGVLADGRSEQALADALLNALDRAVSAVNERAVAGRNHIQMLCSGAAVLEQYQTLFLRRQAADKKVFPTDFSLMADRPMGPQ